MSLIMLAIGGLLALLGAFAMATGYPVIEVERGWSMVIAGAVLLSGGLVVGALGLVVRAINGLKATVTPTAAATVSVASGEPSFSASAGAHPTIPHLVRADDEAPSLAAAAVPAAAAAAFHMPELEPAPPVPDLHRDTPARDLPADLTPPDLATADHEPADSVTPDHEPSDKSWAEPDFSAFDLDARHEAPADPASEPHVEEPHATEAPAIDPHAAEAPEAPAVDPAPEPVAVHTAPDAEPEPVSEAPSTAPEAPPSNLAVIGRYDSDGTSYVMYSDGSIEAQSHSGVVRFGSMAELKAYIEG